MTAQHRSLRGPALTLPAVTIRSGSDVGLDLYLRLYERQVSQFGPALIFVLTFIFPSKWMTRAVAKGCAGTRAVMRLRHNQRSQKEAGALISPFFG